MTAAARRTCVACRTEEDRDDVIRLARSPDGEVVPDLKGTLPGRGAWIHPRAACLVAASTDRAILSRAFKEKTDPGPLQERVRACVLSALADGLSIAAAGGGLVAGHDAAEAGVRSGEIVVLMYANDASERTRASVDRAGAVPSVVVPFDRAELGRRIGQEPRAVVGVRGFSCTVHLRRQLRRAPAVG